MGWVTEHHPRPEGLAACVQCGLCLPVCPTFRITGRETASPRGRLQAMSAVADGVASVDAKFEEILDFCLGCRACEPVCPGMVPYGELLEGARAEIVAQRGSIGRSIRGLVVGRLIASPVFMGAVTLVLRIIQTLHLEGLVPGRLRRSVSGLRRLGWRSHRPITSGLERRHSRRVGLLAGCIQGSWFPEVNAAALELLTRAGFDVVFPEGQTCCGALAAHDGHADAAQQLVSRNHQAFAGCDVIVATAAGCSAHLADSLENATDITAVISAAIDEDLLPSVSIRNGSVVVQDPCHLRHAQRLIDEPRAILRAAGYDLIEMDDDGMCCGAAGLYTILQPEASAELGEKKADLVRSTGTTLVASANPGCEMQLRSFLGNGYRVAHPVELYLQAIRADESSTNVDIVESKS